MDPRLEQRLQALEQDRLRLARFEREVTRWRRLAGLFALVSLVVLAPRAGVSQTTGATLEERLKLLETRMTNVLTRLAHFTRSGNNVYITGANVHIRNGLKATNGNPVHPSHTDPDWTRTNGLGNLIIGYNELRGDGMDARTGSHNLVVGTQQNFTSFGGLLAGSYNTASAPYVSVSGGMLNTASGAYGSVSGGSSNTAINRWSTVSGGNGNEARGPFSSVSGGASNTANSESATVSGGRSNRTMAPYAYVSGGNGNTAWGSYSSLCGGSGNTAWGSFASVSGGASNTASGDFSSVSGGLSNTAGGAYASVSGGRSNTAGGPFASASGGTGINQGAQDGWSAGTYTGSGFGLYQGRFRSP